MSMNGQRALPNVDISPQGLRELEAWLRRPQKPDGPEQWYYVLPLDPAIKPADYRFHDPHPDFEGSWTNASSSDYGTAFGISRIGRQRKLWIKLAVTGEEGATDSLIFTLPPTFRPSKKHRMLVREGPQGIAAVDVNPDGTVVYVNRIIRSGSIDPSEIGLHWGVNNDTDGSGLTLNATNNILIDSGDNLLDFDAGTANSTFVANGFDMDLAGDYRLGVDGAITIEKTDSGGDVTISSNGTLLELQGQGGAITIMTTSADVTIGTDSDVKIKIDFASQEIQFLDSADAAFMRVGAVTGDLHLKAGASIVYDL